MSRNAVLIVAFILIAHVLIALAALAVCMVSVDSIAVGRFRCDGDYRATELLGSLISTTLAAVYFLRAKA